MRATPTATVVLKPARAVLAGFAVFLTVGAAGVAYAFVHDGHLGIGLAILALYFPVVVMLLMPLLPGMAFLRIDEAGFAYRWGPWRQGAYAWRDVEAFGIHWKKGGGEVTLRLRPHHPGFGQRLPCGCHTHIPSFDVKGAATVAEIVGGQLRLLAAHRAHAHGLEGGGPLHEAIAAAPPPWAPHGRACHFESR